MKDDVKSPRRYSSPFRLEQAAATRSQVLATALDLFTAQGYAATTVTQVARAAGVSVDTLYATVGRKSVILREVVESAISGTGQMVPAEERDYVIAVRAAIGAPAKIGIYADAVAAMSPRTAPVFAALRDAAQTDPDCAALGIEISTRRAANMLKFTADLRSTGAVRPELTDQFVADVVWATAGWEHYTQLVTGRGWTPAQFGDYLRETWNRLFLT
ncbi:transcriptional regulator, TetR family [Sanguibacter gelidistatuariae]|uniref:Transcriptional regulator, TetR family n=1 Tax=Sanguibacter gelidistatuariae TaxID=1814289 RepID=A0A1G6MR29_9MICO|nr:TetR family transcriptional regulator [Sanguibacter gelidistatuariae]SDC57911.1 transcriptional regulator, TetR family [Sanguibacter gelidistatuariae]